MEPVIGKKEKNTENLVHKLQHKRKRSNSDDMPTRAIGKDGCDSGGKLLCYDSCSCTYHLRCLNPPLYSTPKGYWQCPNYDHDDLSEPKTNHKKLASNKRCSNCKDDASYTCSLCAKTEKILVLSEDESNKSNSLGFNSEEENLPADNDKVPMENQVMKDLDKSKKNNNEKTNAMSHSAALNTQAALTKEEKYAKHRTRQKQRLCIETLSNLASAGQKQSSDQSAPLYASPYRWRGACDLLASMSLEGQNTTISNTSLLSMFSSTVMGEPLSFGAGTSSDANVDAMEVIPTPTGLLKWKAPIISWAEEELDALWVGVRRYGAGNWDAILGDPTLNCLKNKTQKDLSARWNKELHKFLDPAPISSMPEPLLNAYSYAMGSSFFWEPQWSANTNREPLNGELLLGGHFPLPNFGLNQNMNAGHGSRETHNLPKHAPPDNVIVVDDTDHDDDSDSDDSEKTDRS